MAPAQPTNQPTTSVARGRPQGFCPSEDTNITYLGGCDGYNEFELGWDDSTGYNDAGPLDVVDGCVGGHDECPYCAYENPRTYPPDTPQFEVDTLGGDLYWDYWNINHTTSECQSGCYQDINQNQYGGEYGVFFYSCYQ